MPRDPRTLLAGAGLRPRKGSSQNFLVAQPIARTMARACVHDDEVGRARVIEIGAGTGALTRLLAERACELVAIERDPNLIPLLVRELEGTCARVLQGDAVKLDWGLLSGEPREGSPRVICGNLPYAVTGALLRLAVDRCREVDRVVFMVQSEVAQRLTAAPATPAFGALTVFVQAAFDVRRLLRVPPGAFHPPPAVTSAIVELVPLRPPRARETEAFRDVVHAAFQSRRKMLRNAWRPLVRDPAVLEKAAATAGIALDARGETLDVEAFARMASALERQSEP
ncbi:MAG TPA: 16S rRNA (adenine(1518)-N(6)/adenine(1519)-N(6))-dimethyltransferase RsmA [Polyangiaceae bacterium]|nr:16S rRNA (adenine(1518)-N(6)/adenine(1519)-N(6))-dimethyltransferase RsmA [Polyangiaceae bacterium]